MSHRTALALTALLSFASLVYVSCHPSGLSCPNGQALCGASCIRVLTDRANCGVCGNACAAGFVCSAGACALSCQNGLSQCSGTCRDLKGDTANCGTCGNACASTQVCSMGQCALSCPTGTVDCNGGCFKLDNDPQNCGQCGTACTGGQVCQAGVCVTSCGGAYTACTVGGVNFCANLTNDGNNCGSCGTVCPAGQQCSGSACACAGGTPDACPTAAPTFCTNFNTDNNNCGACGTICPSGEMCSPTGCVVTCTATYTACPSTGTATYCADTQNDNNNCNGCGIVCPAGSTCQTGVCTCPGSQTMCPTAGPPMYCSDTTSDPNNCGSCGNPCTTPPNALPVCSAAQGCGFVCTTGFLDCNTDPGDGCEVNGTNDNNNCGKCGNVCPGSETCTTGVCSNACTGKAGTVDQSQLSAASSVDAGNNSISQTFTAGASGLLTGVELSLCAPALTPADANATVSVSITDGTGAQIALGIINGGAIPVCPNSDLQSGTVGPGFFDLTASCATVTATQTYTVTITTTTYSCDLVGCVGTCSGGPNDGTTCILANNSCNYVVTVGETATDTYAGGSAFTNNQAQTTDLAFKTFVLGI